MIKYVSFIYILLFLNNAIYLKTRIRERDREKQGQREIIFDSLGHFLNGYSGQHWPGLKPDIQDFLTGGFQIKCRAQAL